MNKAATNICVTGLFEDRYFLLSEVTIRGKLLEHRVVTCLTDKESAYSFPLVADTLRIPSSSFGCSASIAGGCVAVPFSFNLHFPNGWLCGIFLLCLAAIQILPFVYLSLFSILIRLSFYNWIEYRSYLYILDTSSLSDIWLWIFPLNLTCLFFSEWYLFMYRSS